MILDNLAQRVGWKLAAARKEAGLSRAELGKMLGLSEAGYGHIEAGRRLLGVEHLVRLPDVLGKPVTCFLPDQAVIETERQKALLHPGLREIVELWPGLDEEGGRLLCAMARRIRRAP